jgi:large subunit ribosomal protein L22
VNLVAELVRGMRVDDALMQMAVSPKRAAKVVAKVVHSARANAVHNYGLNKDRLIVGVWFLTSSLSSLSSLFLVNFQTFSLIKFSVS